MSRFGDTAANAGTLALLDSYDSTSTLPVSALDGCHSGLAGACLLAELCGALQTSH